VAKRDPAIGDHKRMTDFGVANQRDQLNIETPEQVDLRLPIAGIGSRFLAILADSTIQLVAELLLILLFLLFASAAQRSRFGEVSDTAGKWLVAAIVIIQFLLSGDTFRCLRRSGTARRRASGW
jgi:hypothetical protein